jgi:hypothetical protein
LSARGKCSGCGRDRLNRNHDAMLTRSGPMFLHWRRRMAASVGAHLPDDA